MGVQPLSNVNLNFLISGGQAIHIPKDMAFPQSTGSIHETPTNPAAGRAHAEVLQRSPNPPPNQSSYTISSKDLSGRHVEFVALTTNTRQPNQTHKAPAPTTANDSQPFNQQRPHQSIRA